MMAFLVSAYSPTSFSLPSLVWNTDDCEESGGAHTLGHWASALNADHAIGVVYDHDGRRKIEEILQRPIVSESFEIGRYGSWEEGIAAHVELVKTMENGKGDEKWQAGMGLYQLLYDRFYKGVPR